MKKKQTAVEWYGIQIGILISKFLNGEISKSNLHFKRLLLEIEAMQMEKEQNEYFFNCGRHYQLTGEGTFKQVHNETYGQTKN